MDRTLIVADDLTGAAEMAAFASRPQRPARVGWVHAGATWSDAGSDDNEGSDDAPSMVIDTESRNLAEVDARERLAAIAHGLRTEWLRGLVYKKIDSTLRGPIHAEITLLHELTGLGPVIAAPAYPRMGRTTRGGVQHVNGVAAAASPAGADPVAATRESDVALLLPPGDRVILNAPGSSKVQELANVLAHHRNAGRHVVVDAEHEPDLARLAAALRMLPPCLVMATGGLARHLWPHKDLVPAGTAAGSVVVIVGSHHPAAREQAAYLEGAYRCHHLTATSTTATLAEHRDAVLLLTTPSHRVDALVALRDLEHALEEVIALGTPSAVVVTGGESALHALKKLGASSFDVIGELVDGVPIGLIVGGLWAGTILATKAGGFGGPDVLAHAVRRLRSASTESV